MNNLTSQINCNKKRVCRLGHRNSQMKNKNDQLFIG